MPTGPYNNARIPVRKYRRTELTNELAAITSISAGPNGELEDVGAMKLSYSNPDHELYDQIVKTIHPPSGQDRAKRTALINKYAHCIARVHVRE